MVFGIISGKNNSRKQLQRYNKFFTLVFIVVVDALYPFISFNLEYIISDYESIQCLNYSYRDITFSLFHRSLTGEDRGNTQRAFKPCGVFYRMAQSILPPSSLLQNDLTTLMCLTILPALCPKRVLHDMSEKAEQAHGKLFKVS